MFHSFALDRQVGRCYHPLGSTKIATVLFEMNFELIFHFLFIIFYRRAVLVPICGAHAIKACKMLYICDHDQGQIMPTPSWSAVASYGHTAISQVLAAVNKLGCSCCYYQSASNKLTDDTLSVIYCC